jgi:hypothetical protein
MIVDHVSGYGQPLLYVWMVPSVQPAIENTASMAVKYWDQCFVLNMPYAAIRDTAAHADADTENTLNAL